MKTLTLVIILITLTVATLISILLLRKKEKKVNGIANSNLARYIIEVANCYDLAELQKIKKALLEEIDSFPDRDRSEVSYKLEMFLSLLSERIMTVKMMLKINNTPKPEGDDN